MRRSLIAAITFLAGLYYLVTFILPPFLGGDFDNLRTYDPCVLKSDGKYLMWYGGYYNESSMGIGLAESTNGLDWEKYGKRPVLGESRLSSFEDMGIFSPRVIEINGEYVMYYIGRGSDSISRIMMAKSRDGKSWRGRRKVLDLSDPAVKWSKPKFVSLEVIKSDGFYEMWFNGTYIWKGEAINGVSYARSEDGVKWDLHKANPIFQPGAENGDWAPSDIVSINIIKDEEKDKPYQMWYVGTTQRVIGKDNYVAFGAVGYATSRDGTSWEKHDENPVFAPVYHFPASSEVSQLDEGAADTALERLGYKDSFPEFSLDEKKKLLLGIVDLLSNSAEPFRGWPDDKLRVLIEDTTNKKLNQLIEDAAKGPRKLTDLTPESYLDLVRIVRQKPPKLTKEQKQIPGSLKEWRDKTEEYEKLSALRKEALKKIQDHFTGKLGEEKDTDKKFFDSWNIKSIFVLKDGDGYRMYYTGVNRFNSKDFVVGVAEGRNETSWNRVMKEDKSRIVISRGRKGQSTFLWRSENTVTNFLVVVASFAVGLGVINLGKVNAETIVHRKKGWIHSIGFFLGFVSLFVIAVLFRKAPNYTAGYKLFDIYFNGILLAFGGTSMGLLAFYLASASYRSFKFKSVEAGVMMVTAMLIMLAQVPIGQWLTSSLPNSLQIQTVSSWILVNINGAAMRAITIGAAAGAMVMSYRLWLSKDRRN